MFYEPVKRLIDIIFSFAFFILFSPVFVITAFLIWLEDKHSPLYTQTRIGKDDEPFLIYKFRSMVIDADDILFKKDPKLLKQMRSGMNKVKDDYRITKTGRFIRKYSVDEFPQFINVLKGDMSVVGPRALRPDEYEGYAKKSEENERKLKVLTSVKPGVTGYWQTMGRSTTDFDKRMEMENHYAKQKSTLFDLKIMLRTPYAMLKAEGAY